MKGIDIIIVVVVVVVVAAAVVVMGPEEAVCERMNWIQLLKTGTNIGSFEHNNISLGSIKGRKCFHHLSDCHLPKTVSCPWSCKNGQT
jgi:hypothetical protein